MGDAIVADVEAHPGGAAGGGRRVEPRPAPEPNPSRRQDPPDRPAQPLDRPHGARPRCSPRTGSSCSSRPSSTLALRNQLRISRPGSYYFGAGGGLGFGLAASVGVQLAQPDRPVVCVLGEGSAQYAITAFWTAVAYDVPVTFLVLRNEEYAILKWFADVEQVTGAPGLDLPALDVAAVAEGYGVKAAPGRATATSCATRSPAALASSEPELVEVPVAPGHGALLGARPMALLGAKLAVARPAGRRAGARPRARRARRRGRRSRCAASSRRCSAPTACSPGPSTSSATPPTPAPTGCFPQAVVMARDAGDVAKVLAYGREQGIPVTFRAGGTSLNGQGQSDGILVDVRRHFGGVAVEDDGAIARGSSPARVLGHANRVLAPHGRKLGPDPASTDIATRRRRDRQQLRRDALRRRPRTPTRRVRSLTFVLPSGTTIDTAAPGAAERFAEAEPELAAGLAEIRDEIRADAELSERIRRKFEIKNTTGYRLCAFLDADEPLEIFRRLLVGSEGTLAFIAEAVFETVPLPARTTTAWVHFPDIDAGDRPGPRAGRRRRHRGRADGRAGADHRRLEHGRRARGVEGAAARVGGAAGRVRRRRRRRSSTTTWPGPSEILAAREIDPPDRLHPRPRGDRGLLARARGPARPDRARCGRPGTALIIEDVCVPPERIAEGARDIQALLGEHGFLPGVAGHASAGNLHFMLTPDFAKQEDLERYEAFMAELVELIVDKYDGSLKAEHGTGINMAPYVEREWGEKATELMWRVKQLADPDGVLAPGVRPQPRPRRPPAQPEDDAGDRGVGDHLRRVRLLRAGLPEPRPDDDAAPADRAAARDGAPARGLAGAAGAARGVRVRRRSRPAPPTAPASSPARSGSTPASWSRSCAAPPHRAGRSDGAGDGEALGHGRGRLARRPAPRRPAGAGGPKRGQSLPPPAPAKLPSDASTRAPPPSTCPPAPTASSAPPRLTGRNAPYGGKAALDPVVEALVEVSARAGLPVWIPEDVAGTAAGCPGARKGFGEAHSPQGERDGRAALALERGGGAADRGRRRLLHRSIADPGEGVLAEENAERLAKLEILDSVAWAHDRLLPWLEVGEKVGSATVHPTCATRHLGLAHRLEALADALADDVYVAPSATCCGFAGDRGISHPELTAAATAPEAAEVAGRHFDAHLSSNRTCEIGLERATGEPYESVILLLERLTRAAGHQTPERFAPHSTAQTLSSTDTPSR